MAELKPCPFCGCEFKYTVAGFGKHLSENCILTYGSTYNVIDWNTRPLEDAACRAGYVKALDVLHAEICGRTAMDRIPSAGEILDIIDQLRRDYEKGTGDGNQ